MTSQAGSYDGRATQVALSRQFNRDAYTLLGLPFDITRELDTCRHLLHCIREQESCFFSTPNLNFLITSQQNDAFRDSVLDSDWVVADGMPLVWIGKILGVPLPERVPGSGVFDVLRRGGLNERAIKVFFFGGDPGVAEKAAAVINAEQGAMRCVGWHSPGFGSIEDMSSDTVIAEINAAEPDFLVVALGAAKGQAWIMHNRSRLAVPVISHLGAVVNFVAGTVKRAPGLLQAVGAEWLWRIYEEPRLFRRYWHDGLGFLRLLVGSVLPAWRLHRRWAKRLARAEPAVVDTAISGTRARVSMSGVLQSAVLGPIKSALVSVVVEAEHIELDFTGVEYVDPAALAVFQLLSRTVAEHGGAVSYSGLSANVRRQFVLARVDYLLV